MTSLCSRIPPWISSYQVCLLPPPNDGGAAHPAMYSTGRSLVRLEEGLARSCPGSEAWRYCFYLGEQLCIRLQSLLMLIQGYGEVTIPEYPYLKPLISDYHRGPDQLGMATVSPTPPYSHCSPGPYWEQPGRSIVEGLLQDIPAATEVCPNSFSEFRRTYFSCTPPCNTSLQANSHLTS